MVPHLHRFQHRSPKALLTKMQRSFTFSKQKKGPRRKVARMSWERHAACKGMDIRIFFVTKGSMWGTREAKATCARCPVRSECLAAHVHEHHGIFGGLSPKQRRAYIIENQVMRVCKICEKPCTQLHKKICSDVCRDEATRRANLRHYYQQHRKGTEQ